MKKILIVEDDKIFALSLKITLLKNGFDVLPPVDTAEQGFQSAMNHRPDIILMDILLKGNETGIDAALQINNNMHIPVIFMTGNDELVEKTKIINLKKYCIYPKPVDEDILIEAIDKIIS